MLKKGERSLLMRARDGLARVDIEPADAKLINRLRRQGWLNAGYRDGVWTLVTSRAGMTEMQRPAPPPPPGRLQCVNPICTKTAAQEQHPGCDSIICGTCFRMTGDLRREYRTLRALWRRIERRRAQRQGEIAAVPIGEIGILKRIDQNWAAIVAFFNAPERPEGLDEFLKEMGWTDDGEVQQQPVWTEEL